MLKFSPDFDIGNLITILTLLAGMYLASRKWQGSVEEKFQLILNRLSKVEEKQTDQGESLKTLKGKADTIEDQMGQQAIAMARMEISVVDPLRRFAILEAEHSSLVKDMVKFDTHMTDLEKRIEEQNTEIKTLRQRIHDMSGTAQIRANTEAIDRLRPQA